MAKPILPDDLWQEIAPLLPAAKPCPQGGRPPLENRAALTGILFVLRTGIPWAWRAREGDNIPNILYASDVGNETFEA